MRRAESESDFTEEHSFLSRIADLVNRVAETFLWLGFATLTASVAMQIIARNVLKIPMIWTADLAQLCFTWVIFIGAAVGLRRGVHFTVEVLPMDRPAIRNTTFWISFAAGLIVTYLLIWHGWMQAQLRASGEVQSLGISRFWMFFSFPVSGAIMLLFLIEAARDHCAQKPTDQGAE